MAIFSPTRALAHFLLLLTAIIWGVAFVFQKNGMAEIGAFAFIFYRFLAGSVALAPVALLEYRSNPLHKSVSRENLQRYGRNLVLLGSLGLGAAMFIGSALQQVSLNSTSVANAAYLTTLYVPLVPLFGLAFFRIRLPAARWAAVAIFMVGSWMLTGASLNTITQGDLIVSAGAVFWALHIMLVGVMVRTTQAPFQLAFLQTIITALLALPVLIATSNPITYDLHILWLALPDILFAGVVSTALGFTLQMVAQRNCSASAAAIILSLEGVFAALAGWIMLGQAMTIIAMLGAGLIMAAVLLVELNPVKPRP